MLTHYDIGGRDGRPERPEIVLSNKLTTPYVLRIICVQVERYSLDSLAVVVPLVWVWVLET